MRHARAQQRARALERRARRQRRVEVAALRGGEQLDRDDVRGVLRHAARRRARVRRHRDVILLVGRGRDRVDARRIGALLVLRDQRRGRHLRDHEAGVEPRLRREERRQAGQRRIDQHGDAPLGERADLADRQREHVGGERDRLGVEVAAGQRLAACRRRSADCRRRRSPRSRASRRPGAAGRAPRPSPAAGSAGNRGPARGRRWRGARRGCALPAISARSAAATSIWPRWPRSAWMRGIERRVGAVRRIGRERAGDQRGLEHALDREQAGERVGGRELRAVEQREPFLRAERERRRARRARAPRRPACARRRGRPRRRRSSRRSCARAARDRPTRRPSPAPGPPG